VTLQYRVNFEFSLSEFVNCFIYEQFSIELIFITSK
jgi:hypothetical protein